MAASTIQYGEIRSYQFGGICSELLEAKPLLPLREAPKKDPIVARSGLSAGPSNGKSSYKKRRREIAEDLWAQEEVLILSFGLLVSLVAVKARFPY